MAKPPTFSSHIFGMNRRERITETLQAVKGGATVGATVGAIFGSLTGAYAAILYRRPALIPLSMFGGAATFGFFLGCGMLVRCVPQKNHHR